MVFVRKIDVVWLEPLEVAKKLGMNPFQYCTLCKEEYMRQLAALNKGLVPDFSDLAHGDDRVMCFAKSGGRVFFFI